ncbi:hypothetical protein V8D89_009960 [Ganoderma adspersum]
MTGAQRLTQTLALLQQNRDTFKALERDTQLAMVKLRRCQNESVPVNQLPPELLRMVFAHLRPPPSPRRTAYLTPPIEFASYEPLVSAMLVCHKWYAIASDAASLWTDIDFQRQRTFAPILLTRSSGAAIHLCGYISIKDNTLETAIKDNGARIRELDLWARDSVPALQSILAVDMLRLRVLCLSCKDPRSTQMSTLLTGVPASFPSLKAVLLESCLFVPDLPLPQLTHVHLGKMDRVDAANILDLLRNTPALEYLDITSSTLTVPLNSSTISSPVALPRLQSAHIAHSTATEVHYLMTSLEVPALAFLDLSRISVGRETLSSTPLLPRSIDTHTMRRLALCVNSTSTFFHTTLHGSNASLDLSLHARAVPNSEWMQWARADLPLTVLPLPLPSIEEFHFQAGRWEAPRDLLPHLAPLIPTVSTLLVKHNPRDDDDNAEVKLHCHMTLARVLERDSPVLFPHLAHLALVVSWIPPGFCELLARALKRRDEGGRRVRKLRICVDGEYSRFRGHWKPYAWWMDPARDYRKTGIFDHVDDGDGDLQRLGWGRWKDCVRRARHEYWRDSRSRGEGGQY